MNRIYLDHAATTSMYKDVIQIITEIMHENGNASSMHMEGQKANNIILKSKNGILKNLSFDPAQYDLIFTSCGTEANNLALNTKSTKIISKLEHSSIKNIDNGAIFVNYHNDTIIDLDDLEKKIQGNQNPIVSVVHANSETGILNPISDIGQICKKMGVLFHTDIIQSCMKTDIDNKNIDMATISAHKIGGPKGIGALIYKKGIKINPMIFGGKQQYGIRPGTINHALAAGFYKAIKISKQKYPYSRLREFEDEIKKFCKNNNIIFVGEDKKKLPNIMMLIKNGKNATEQLIYFDLNNIAVSTGSACTSGDSKKSQEILSTLGLKTTDHAIRVSTGWNTTQNEIKQFLNVYQNM